MTEVRKHRCRKITPTSTSDGSLKVVAGKNASILRRLNTASTPRHFSSHLG